MKREELIMLLHDGELDPSQAEEAEALLAEPEMRAFAEELRRMGTLVREAESARAAPPDLAPAIMARVLNESEPAHPVKGRLRPVRRARPPGAIGLLGAALALAAIVALLFGRPSARSGEPAPLARVPASAPAPASADPGGEPPVAIESVDFGSRQGAIFVVSSGATETMVVWTLDEPDDDRSTVN